MTVEEFRASLTTDAEPPAGLSAALRALWLDGKGRWAAAHALVDDPDTEASARVHAYLHRKQGDLENARYWYAHAGATPSAEPLEREWEQVLRELLAAE